MSVLSSAICFGGGFPFLPFYDLSLQTEHFRIEALENFRVVQVPFCDSPRWVVAAAGMGDHVVTQVYDVISKHQICECSGHASSVHGLASLASTFSSNPLIVSGSSFDEIFVFDAVNGTKLCSLPDVPFAAIRIVHVPEWNRDDVFVGGSSGCLCRFDLEKQQRIGQFLGYDEGQVWGLSVSVEQKLLFSTVLASSRSRTLRVWSRDDYTCEKEVSLTESSYACHFVESKSLLLVGLNNGHLDIWDLRKTGQRMSSFGLFGGSVSEIVQIDENSVVVGSSDHTAVVWNFSGGVKKKMRFPGMIKGLCRFGNSHDYFSFCEGEDGAERWEFGLQQLERSVVSVVLVHLEGHSTFFVCGWILDCS